MYCAYAKVGSDLNTYKKLTAADEKRKASAVEYQIKVERKYPIKQKHLSSFNAQAGNIKKLLPMH
jgi:hypothetical protein